MKKAIHNVKEYPPPQKKRFQDLFRQLKPFFFSIIVMITTKCLSFSGSILLTCKIEPLKNSGDKKKKKKKKKEYNEFNLENK